jgi:hypothetical protein
MNAKVLGPLLFLGFLSAAPAKEAPVPAKPAASPAPSTSSTVKPEYRSQKGDLVLTDVQVRLEPATDDETEAASATSASPSPEAQSPPARAGKKPAKK